MSKLIPDAIIDLQLDQVEGTHIHVCSQEPATFLEATTTYNLASDNVGAYVKANGDSSGRKNTQAGTTDTDITSTGIANHIAITTLAGSILKLVTTATSLALTSGGTVDIGSFKHEIGDPS
ncbi:MAG: hypothetical protein GY928_00575 [Colwellia sp.]|nr:hypothetical protein [Colwellia sp.]